MNNPLRSLGSNQVDLGGISLPQSATASNSSMEEGYIAKAIFSSPACPASCQMDALGKAEEQLGHLLPRQQVLPHVVGLAVRGGAAPCE